MSASYRGSNSQSPVYVASSAFRGHGAGPSAATGVGSAADVIGERRERGCITVGTSAGEASAPGALPPERAPEATAPTALCVALSTARRARLSRKDWASAAPAAA